MVYAESPKQGDELSKFYAKNAPPELMGKGFVTMASALLFQALIAKGVTEVWGEIDGKISNERSIRSRLNTSNIIDTVFFTTDSRVVPLPNGSYELYLTTHLDHTTLSVSVTEFLADIRRKLPAI